MFAIFISFLFLIFNQFFAQGTWLEFLETYFSEPLGLKYAKRYPDDHECHLDFVLNADIPQNAPDRCLYYSLAQEDATPGGLGMLMSTTAYSIFLSKYISGEYSLNRTAIEIIRTPYEDLPPGYIWSTGYSSGHWGLVLFPGKCFF